MNALSIGILLKSVFSKQYARKKQALILLNTNISRVIGIPINQIIADIDNYNFYDLQESTLKIQLKSKILDKNIDYYGSLNAIKGNKNYIIGYLILLYDITELVVTLNKLKQANDELKRLMTIMDI